MQFKRNFSKTVLCCRRPKTYNLLHGMRSLSITIQKCTCALLPYFYLSTFWTACKAKSQFNKQITYPYLLCTTFLQYVWSVAVHLPYLSVVSTSNRSTIDRSSTTSSLQRQIINARTNWKIPVLTFRALVHEFLELIGGKTGLLKKFFKPHPLQELIHT